MVRASEIIDRSATNIYACITGLSTHGRAAGSSICAQGHRGERPFPLFLVSVDGAVYKFDSWLGDEGAVVRVLDRGRFPPPWTVDEQRLCFVVRDQSGQAVARLYFEEDSSRRSAAKLHSRDKARWIAARIRKLPELLQSR
jgi:hypothetical protein